MESKVGLKNKVMKHTSSHFLILILAISVHSYAQERDVEFTPFVGIVYDMPVVEHWIGKIKRFDFREYYSDAVYSYDSIGTISLKNINVPETDIDDALFPGVDLRVRFAMVLHSEMRVNREGCYEVSLSSDDGSRLWINDELVVNNDGSHQLETEMDTVYLTKGQHAAKLWYFQGLPYHYALMMDVNRIPSMNDCHRLEEQNYSSKSKIENLLFETDEYSISALGEKELIKLANQINRGKVKRIKVIGFADQQGSTDYNLNLSSKRADAVVQLLKEYIRDPNIRIISEANGEVVHANQNDIRKEDRRVEIWWD